MFGGSRRLWLAAGLLVLPAVVAGLAEPQALRYERAPVLAGEWWRLFTGHWLHTNSNHLLTNLAGLAAVLLVLGRFLSPVSLLLSALAGALTVSLCLLLLAPDVTWYVGLSGVVAAVWACGAMRGALGRDWLGWAALLLLIAKVAWEQLAGAPVELSHSIDADVVVNAHLYGLAAGLLAGWLTCGRPGSATSP